MADEVEFKTELWVYLRRAILVSGKEGVMFQQYTEEDGLIGDELIYDHKPGYAVGGIYEIQVARIGDNIRVRFGSAKYVGQYPNEERVEEWRVADRLKREEFAADRLQKKWKRGYELPSDWDELVRTAAKLSYGDRLTFNQLVMAKFVRDVAAYEKAKGGRK